MSDEFKGDRNENVYPTYSYTVDHLLKKMSLPAGSIWIERVGVKYRVVHADFSAFSSSASNEIYVALKSLVKDSAGVWIVILDHEDWRREKRIAALKARLDGIKRKARS